MQMQAKRIRKREMGRRGRKEIIDTGRKEKKSAKQRS